VSIFVTLCIYIFSKTNIPQKKRQKKPFVSYMHYKKTRIRQNPTSPKNSKSTPICAGFRYIAGQGLSQLYNDGKMSI